ncbi:hypothetical protein LXL04_006769 [Taraxacum kok-saghyz]
MSGGVETHTKSTGYIDSEIFKRYVGKRRLYSRICMWDPCTFVKSQVTTSRNFLVISGKWIGVPGTTTIVNVYVPQSITDKRRLWTELLNLKRSIDGVWIFLGDFNAVRFQHERFNSSFCKHTAIGYWIPMKRKCEKGAGSVNFGVKKKEQEMRGAWWYFPESSNELEV